MEQALFSLSVLFASVSQEPLVKSLVPVIISSREVSRKDFITHMKIILNHV